MAKKTAEPFQASDALLETFYINDRINDFLFKDLPEEAWRSPQPGGKGRTIAAIASHMHNVRVMWLKAAGGTIPPPLEKERVTIAQARKALEESREALAEVIKSSLAADGRIKGFKPHVAAFVGYLIAHDAHHRGQITMLARQAGHPVSQKTMFGMWEWGVR